MSRWEEEVDVLILGLGLAGAVAAVCSHDNGAEVLVLEKGAHGGGLSVLSAGLVKCASNAEAAALYLTHLSGGRVDADLIQVFAEGLAQNEAFLRELGEIDHVRINRTEEWAGEAVGSYPFPGREAFYLASVAGMAEFHGFPWAKGVGPGGDRLFKIALDNMEKRGIPVRFDTRAVSLETDGTGAVIGVVAEQGERKLRIGARRGVVLATGGFEQNQWLQKQHLQGMPFYSLAPATHTGDGILMAQKVGAALWHMWHLHASYGFKFDGQQVAFRHSARGTRNPHAAMPWVIVDRFGRRYMNECPPATQDTAYRAMEVFDADIPGYPRIPSYMIFDDRARQRGPIAKPAGFGETYDWSRDNAREIEKGWIISGSTAGELAAKIAAAPENGGLMTSENLEDTILRWNSSVSNGEDEFHRPSGTMLPIDSPPFYAAPVWPVITNTQGGPVHNAKQQVLDSFGAAIPHLYAAGELGSFFGHLYEQAGNLAECLISGRIAGVQAARQGAAR